MRILVGYIDGRPIWEDQGPSYARIPGHRGSLVTGGPGPNDKDVHNRRNAVAKALTRNQSKLDARPIRNGRPRKSDDVPLVGRGFQRVYASDEERLAARRQSWRESKARRRAA